VKRSLLSVLSLLWVCLLAAQTVITQPNPELRYETRYTTQDLSLRKIDTLLEDFHRYNPIYEWEVPYIAPNMANVPRPLWFDPKRNIGYQHGYNLFDNYFFTTDSARYYNTKTPFTSAMYVFGAKEETYINVIHSQNINPNFNLAMDYRRPVSPGFYNRQKSGIHNFSLTQWYKSPTNRYNLMTAYIFNQAKIQENGGVAAEDIFTNIAYAQDMATAPVYLADAENKLNNNNIALRQTFFIGPETSTAGDSTRKKTIQPKYGLTHLLEYSSTKVWYKDNENDSSYYTNFYVFADSSRDQTKSWTLRNEIYLQNYAAQSEDSLTSAFKYSWRGGFRYELNRWQQQSISAFRHGLQLFGSIKNSTLIPRKWSYSLEGEVELAPRYSGDFNISGQVQYQPGAFFYVQPFLNVNLQSPAFRLQQFRTNHYQWDNDFRKQFLIEAGGKVGIPKWNLHAGVSYYLVHNYLYFADNSQPAQLSQPIQVIRLTVEKNFMWKRFVFRNLASLQWASAGEIVQMPHVYLKHQLYYRGSYIKKKPIHAQLGMDITYFDNHYADAYNPSVMAYHLQHSDKLSYYPVIDLFFNLQVKRARLFFSVQHANQGLIWDGYFTSPERPAQPRAFRAGMSWQFYD